MISIRPEFLTQVPGVPEFWIVDLFDARLVASERDSIMVEVADIMHEYFPSYAHVVEDFERQLESSVPPKDELVHVWLVIRDGIACGVWVMNVNSVTGVIMMLFGAIHRQARIDLPREYLSKLVGFMHELCLIEAKGYDFTVFGVILESAERHIDRWESCGFFVADDEYREPKHGIHWAAFGPPDFYDDYSACVLPIAEGTRLQRAELGQMCLETLLIEHYGLPKEHPAVMGSLARARNLVG